MFVSLTVTVKQLLGNDLEEEKKKAQTNVEETGKQNKDKKSTIIESRSLDDTSGLASTPLASVNQHNLSFFHLSLRKIKCSWVYFLYFRTN